jgi:hypothetical protein
VDPRLRGNDENGICRYLPGAKRKATLGNFTLIELSITLKSMSSFKVFLPSFFKWVDDNVDGLFRFLAGGDAHAKKHKPMIL